MCYEDMRWEFGLMGLVIMLYVLYMDGSDFGNGAYRYNVIDYISLVMVPNTGVLLVVMCITALKSITRVYPNLTSSIKPRSLSSGYLLFLTLYGSSDSHEKVFTRVDVSNSAAQ